MASLVIGLCIHSQAHCQTDPLREMQDQAIVSGQAKWGYWGTSSGGYYDWCNHSNRLIPVYTFGMNLDTVKKLSSVYRDQAALEKMYGRVPEGTLNPSAEYFDQTDLFRLQLSAIEAGKKYIVVIIFDGLDWHTTRAAAIYRSGKVGYDAGRGTGLSFQDYRNTETDFGFCVTSPHNETTEFNVDTQTLTKQVVDSTGGYDFQLAGATPWEVPRDMGYLIGWNERRYHPITDSANAATAILTGRKTYNGSVNLAPDGQQLQTVAHILQRERGFAIGVVTNVPISHATPAAAYAHNVSRLDYQDLSRDLLGLPSISHATEPLAGVDVLLGAGWSDDAATDTDQGANHRAGNKYLTDIDQLRLETQQSGKYVVVQRQTGTAGIMVLDQGVRQANHNSQKLLGIFGVKSGHLPYRTADGDYQPTTGVAAKEIYSTADIQENPKLSDLTSAALQCLSRNPNGFWLMVEAGDVDWASHDVNIDNTIGAILSGDEAFATVTEWIEANQLWKEAAVIVTSDHGHGFVLTDPSAISNAGMVSKTR